MENNQRGRQKDFEYGNDRSGYFQFGALERNIGYRIEDAGEHKRIEFSFEGVDERDPISGRGWLQTTELYLRVEYISIAATSHFSRPRNYSVSWDVARNPLTSASAHTSNTRKWQN